MSDIPTRTLTFLFTDIEGSTDLAARLGDCRYADALAECRRVLRAVFTEGGGQEIGTQGDSFQVSFHRARDAVTAAVAAQRAMAMHPWPEGALLRVRMGLHTGEPANIAGEYVGLDVHRAARICAAGHGGQILLSLATSSLIENDLPPGVSLRDLGSHRLKDLQQPERILQVLHPDVLVDFPPLKSLDTLANNLPRQLTTFIGREREMREVKRLLSTTRLLTLTGSGGCGKTRLALQVAADVLEEYTDGVWVVELAVLSEPAFVPQTVAAALAVREVPGRSLMATLLNHTQRKTLLLVLDNCEHLVVACAQLAEALLSTCPDLRILATSREALDIPGEVTWRVPSLSFPDARRAPGVQNLAQYEAVRLFIDRAAASLPSFTLTPQNVRAVVEVCQRLDGIPLAIEMAAARVPAMSVEEIAARLNDRFRLLTRGGRTTLPRHQTLRAALDWSYHLLSEGERMLLRRLSVFAAGWTLEAAESVCTGNGVGELDVLDLMTQLVLKSQVLKDEQSGRAWYRFLETVWHYCREKLTESNESRNVRERHLTWYMALAERAESELTGAAQRAWFDRLEVEHDNVRVALEWSLEGGSAETGLRLAGAVWRFWFVRGYLKEGRRWLEAVIKRSSDATPAARAKALNAAGYLAVLGESDYAAGRAFLEESLALWRGLEDRQGIALGLHNLGNVASDQGDLGAAYTFFEEALSIRRELEDKWGIAHSLHQLGLVAYRQGEYGMARTLYEESLEILRARGDKQHIATALNNLGLVATRQHDYLLAREFLEEALAIRQELGDKWGIAFLLEGFADFAAAQGLSRHAVRLFGAAEALREVIGAPLSPAARINYERNVAAARSSLSEDDFMAEWASGRAMSLEEAIAEARRSEGECGRNG